MKTKKCTKCHEIKNHSEFHRKKDSGPSKLQSWCKSCKNKGSREYRAKNDAYNAKRRLRRKEDPEYRQKELDRTRAYHKNNRVKILEDRRTDRLENPEKYKRERDEYNYGLTQPQSDLITSIRQNQIELPCECCKTRIKDFKIDHLHGTKIVRGILCNACNTFEGRLKEQLKLGTLILNGWWKDYLENPPGIDWDKLKRILKEYNDRL